ncbi:response regulator transcription factor [Paenibacillus sp. S-38]|uniref:response regulator transcription factor n=1 Tax=Paenibacillus sp. S-38 TaxID=3416710 RepID=UPI003CFAAAFC
MANLLAVDDETAVAALIKNVLQKDGHMVTALTDPSQIAGMQLGKFDLILLDVMMPGIDGYAVCRDIRTKVDCPILFLTAKTMERDVMAGLAEGADDYISKPFGAGELRARVAAHLRRERRERRSILSVGEAAFNLSGKQLEVGGEAVPLTKSEYEICEFLARNRGQVFSKEHIYESVFGYEGESDATAVVEHIKNIRRKLAQAGLTPIETVWGIGYLWKG